MAWQWKDEAGPVGRLEYKYMKLVEGKAGSGELPSAESCALGEDEEDEDENDSDKVPLPFTGSWPKILTLGTLQVIFKRGGKKAGSWNALTDEREPFAYSNALQD